MQGRLAGIKTVTGNGLVLLFVLSLTACVTTPGIGRHTDAEIQFSVDAGTWLKGDFHAHSTWSDGDSGVSEILSHAEAQGMDFFALTDHDMSTGGSPAHWKDESFVSGSMVLLYGIEWTSALGHANIFSGAPFDYEPLYAANLARDAKAAVTEAEDQGLLFSINHPAASNCPWLYESFPGADCMEVWNGPFALPNRNRQAITDVWEPSLLSGLRIPGIGASDSHQLKGFQKDYNSPGFPSTWVYAEEISGSGVLDAVRRGRVSISFSPQADRLELYADADGDGIFETMMGDAGSLTGNPDGEVDFLVKIVPVLGEDSSRHIKKYTLHIIKNGRNLYSIRFGKKDEGKFAFSDRPGERSFYRAELRGNPGGGFMQNLVRGNLLAMTNPIYFGYPDEGEKEN